MVRTGRPLALVALPLPCLAVAVEGRRLTPCVDSAGNDPCSEPPATLGRAARGGESRRWGAWHKDVARNACSAAYGKNSGRIIATAIVASSFFFGTERTYIC